MSPIPTHAAPATPVGGYGRVYGRGRARPWRAGWLALITWMCLTGWSLAAKPEDSPNPSPRTAQSDERTARPKPASEPASPPSGRRKPSRVELKLALLIGVTRLSTWPSESLGETNQPFRIGMLGRSPFGTDLQRSLSLAGTIQGRPVLLVTAGRPEELRQCHMVYVSSDRDVSLDSVVVALGKRPILLAGDEPDFARRGGMVNLREKAGDFVGVEICRETVEASGLGFRASLSKVNGIDWVTPAKAP